MFEALNGRSPKSIDENEYRKFAVMVALVKRDDGLNVVFENGTEVVSNSLCGGHETSRRMKEKIEALLFVHLVYGRHEAVHVLFLNAGIPFR